jgi:DNA-binding CsgD family transcriptional regulator
VTKITEKTLLNLVGSAYEAALKPELWPAHVELWRATLRSNQAKFLLYDLNNRCGTIEASAGADPHYDQLYQTHFAGVSPWVAAGMDAIAPGQVLRCETLLPQEKLERTEFYNDFLKPQGVFYAGGPVLFRDRGVFGALVVGRSAEVGPFTDEELALQQRMLPHLQRAVELHRRLAAAENARAGLLSAVETMPGGVLLVDDRSRLVALNREASTIFERRDGLALNTRGEVAPQCPDTAAGLAQLIGAALATTGGGGYAPGGSLRIARPSGKAPYTVQVSPLCSLSTSRESGSARAVLYIDDPESKRSPVVDGLKTTFGLTRAEAGLALRLAGGQSLSEAANELNVSLNTVRTHLKRIFSKTDTRRQGELVSLLLTRQPATSRIGPQA